MKKRKMTCIRCRSEIAVNQFERHYASKICAAGLKIEKSKPVCPHCNAKRFDLEDASINFANHVKWCKNNPKRGKGVSSKPAWNTGLSKEDSTILADISKKISGAHARGRYDHIEYGKYWQGRSHTLETKKKMAISARSSGHQRVCKSTHQYVDKIGRVFMFDSSWEDILADRLDLLGIQWGRPKPLSYIDSKGRKRNYFADFYLPDYNLYLDPKNQYVRMKQREKLNIILAQYPVVLLNLDECKNFKPSNYCNGTP